MGAEHSKHHQEESNPNSTSFDVEQSEEVTAKYQSVVLARGKVAEIEVEAVQLRETLKVLDTKCEVLKYENKYLRGQVINLKEKVEMLENANKEQELKISSEMNNFEERIKSLESQIRVNHSPPPQISKQDSATAFTPTDVYKSCSKVYKSYVPPFKICQDKNPLSLKREETQAIKKEYSAVVKATKFTSCIKTSDQKQKGGEVFSSVETSKVQTLKYYDHLLPDSLVKLCTVARCGLCGKNLTSQLLASEHYWSRKHFKELEAYLEKIYKNTPELKPKFKSSLTYSRPLPEAIISKCTRVKCGLCNVSFSDSCYDEIQDHYYGSEHNKEILRFLQKNTEHWKEGLTSPCGSKSLNITSPTEFKKTPKSVTAPSNQARAITFTAQEVNKSCSKVDKSSVPIGICLEKNPPTKVKKEDTSINKSNQEVSCVKSNKVHTLKYYDHPLPANLVQLCTVTRCGLCKTNLASQLLASKHYWSRKHFEVLKAYLDQNYKDTPDLKPNFISSFAYNRPLPQAILSILSKEECGLCNLAFSDSCYDSVKDHYRGMKHNEEIHKFIQKNTEHWQEGLVNTIASNGGSTSQKTASPGSKKTLKSVAAPASWLPGLSQSVPAETRSQLKGKRHAENVDNLLEPEDTTDNLIDLSEDFLDYDAEVMLSDITKEVITVSESCIAPGLDPVSIGLDTTKDGEEIVESVIIINKEGGILLDQIVPTNECEEDLVTEKVLDHIKVQLKLKEVIKDKLLVGYDLSNKLKVLNLDHPEHLSLDIRDTFGELVPGVKPSLKLIIFKFLEKVEYEHSRSNEAQVTMEIFKKVGKRLKKKASKKFECRILMPKSVMAVLRNKGRKILKEVSCLDVFFSIPLVGGVVSIFADDIGSLSKALHDLLQLLDYAQLTPQIKMIVPCRLPVKKKDFVAKNVTMYGLSLPRSKEKVVEFGGGVLEMISGVEQCLLLMEKNKEFSSYGGPGSRYDYSDHDGQTAAPCGDWDDGNADVPTQEDVECCSCHVVGLQHFSGTQLKWGEARRCYSCICT